MGRDTSRHHAYELWTDERYAELVELLATELPLAEIAQRTGRSTSALQNQLRKLVPLDYSLRPGDAEEVVRTLLVPPSYDWRAVLRERAKRVNQVYWDSEKNDLLRQGWEQARSMEEITEAVDASELDVARQLMRLDLAENSREVAQRLGCDPTGTLAGRLRLAEDRAAAAVWVLVVDGTRGTGRIPVGVAEERRDRRHVSVHLDYDTADLTLDDLLRAHTDAGGDLDTVTASITERTVGDLTVGEVANPARPARSVEMAEVLELPDLDAELADLQPDPAPPARKPESRALGLPPMPPSLRRRLDAANRTTAGQSEEPA
ncbi:hypothetical protein [Nocardia tengchongensis]|uniref:hypothetical protein n=1 Tax=Nocardia tengchongensis TaxID=2055889 RepID=UPI0036060279